jgi:hypothetical protein
MPLINPTFHFHPSGSVGSSKPAVGGKTTNHMSLFCISLSDGVDVKTYFPFGC